MFNTAADALAFSLKMMNLSQRDLREVHEAMLKHSIFTCEGDDAYFILNVDGAYHVIVGQTMLDGTFEVNHIYTYTSRDLAILSCLGVATNDAGHTGSNLEWARENAAYLISYN